MPVHRSNLTRPLAAAAMVIATSLFALAQQPQTVRIRGTIESVDGATLMIKSREGTDLKVRMTDNATVFGVTKTALSEIKGGSYIGVTGMPEPDGTQKAGPSRPTIVASVLAIWGDCEGK